MLDKAGVELGKGGAVSITEGLEKKRIFELRKRHIKRVEGSADPRSLSMYQARQDVGILGTSKGETDKFVGSSADQRSKRQTAVSVAAGARDIIGTDAGMLVRDDDGNITGQDFGALSRTIQGMDYKKMLDDDSKRNDGIANKLKELKEGEISVEEFNKSTYKMLAKDSMREGQIVDADGKEVGDVVGADSAKNITTVQGKQILVLNQFLERLEAMNK